MRYLSLFAGIGGFELAVQRVFGQAAHCVGYSEIDPLALRVYRRHFPTHTALGDVRALDEPIVTKLYHAVGGIDLVVGGFPCQNLSTWTASGKTNYTGLKGKKSGLLMDMIRIMKVIQTLNRAKNKPTYFIIENVRGSKKNRMEIQRRLAEDFDNVLEVEVNSEHFSAQRRLRYLWVNFPVTPIPKTLRGTTIESILEPVSEVRNIMHEVQHSARMVGYMNGWLRDKNAAASSHFQAKVQRETDGVRYYTFERDTPPEAGMCVRWMRYAASDSAKAKSRTIASHFPNVFIERRLCPDDAFVIRCFFPQELERLFTFPVGWTAKDDKGKPIGKKASTRLRVQLLGNSVVVDAIAYVVKHLKQHVSEGDK